MLATTVRATDGMITWEMAMESFGDLFLYVLWPVPYVVILLLLFDGFTKAITIRKKTIIGMIAWLVYIIGTTLYLNFIWKNYVSGMVVDEAMPMIIGTVGIWNMLSFVIILFLGYIRKNIKE